MTILKTKKLSKQQRSKRQDPSPVKVQRALNNLAENQFFREPNDLTGSQELALALMRIPTIKRDVMALKKRKEVERIEIRSNNFVIERLMSAWVVSIESYSCHLKHLMTENYGGTGFVGKRTCNGCIEKKRQWEMWFQEELIDSGDKPKYHKDGSIKYPWEMDTTTEDAFCAECVRNLVKLWTI